MADLLRSLNGTSNVSMSISVNGQNVLQIGKNVVQYQINPYGTIGLDGYQSSGGDQIAAVTKVMEAEEDEVETLEGGEVQNEGGEVQTEGGAANVVDAGGEE